LDVKYREIVKLLIHFGKTMPVLFFYTSTRTGAMIRELLGMQDPKGPYYDPAGKGVYMIYMNFLYFKFLFSFCNLMMKNYYIYLISIIFDTNIYIRVCACVCVCRKDVKNFNKLE